MITQIDWLNLNDRLGMPSKQAKNAQKDTINAFFSTLSQNVKIFKNLDPPLFFHFRGGPILQVFRILTHLRDKEVFGVEL